MTWKDLELDEEELVNIPCYLYFSLNKNEGIIKLNGEEVLLVKIGIKNEQSYSFVDSVIRRKKLEILHI